MKIQGYMLSITWAARGLTPFFGVVPPERLVPAVFLST